MPLDLKDVQSETKDIFIEPLTLFSEDVDFKVIMVEELEVKPKQVVKEWELKKD